MDVDSPARGMIPLESEQQNEGGQLRDDRQPTEGATSQPLAKLKFTRTRRAPAPPSAARAAAVVKLQAPQKGWPLTQGDDCEWKTKDQDDAQAQAWCLEASPEDAVLLTIAGRGANDDGSYRREGDLRELLEEAWGVKKAHLKPASPKGVTPRPNFEPLYLLLGQLSPTKVTEILNEPWASNEKITIRAIPWTDDPPTHVATFYQRRLPERTEECAIATIRAGLRTAPTSRAIREMINEERRAGRDWLDAHTDEVFEHILESVDVHFLDICRRGQVPDPIFTVYVEPPTSDAKRWLDFKNLIRGTRFGRAADGYLRLYMGRLWCKICHTTDHPTGKCPMPDVPGWKGPSIEDALGDGGWQPPAYRTDKKPHAQGASSTHVGRGGFQGGSGDRDTTSTDHGAIRAYDQYGTASTRGHGTSAARGGRGRGRGYRGGRGGGRLEVYGGQERSYGQYNGE